MKRDVREYTRGMGYALPRPVRRWLDGKVFGLREPLKLAIIRLANLVGRYHTGPPHQPSSHQMRAEIEQLSDAAKQSIGLLRRHL